MIQWKRVLLVAAIAAVSTATAEVLRQSLVDDNQDTNKGPYG